MLQSANSIAINELGVVAKAGPWPSTNFDIFNNPGGTPIPDDPFAPLVITEYIHQYAPINLADVRLGRLLLQSRSSSFVITSVYNNNDAIVRAEINILHELLQGASIVWSSREIIQDTQFQSPMIRSLLLTNQGFWLDNGGASLTRRFTINCKLWAAAPTRNLISINCQIDMPNTAILMAGTKT